MERKIKKSLCHVLYANDADIVSQLHEQLEEIIAMIVTVRVALVKVIQR